MSNQSSGGLGILGLIGTAVLFLILRRFSPSLSRLFLIIGIIAISCVLVLVALVLYFTFRKPKKKPDSASNRTVLLQKGRSDLLELRQLTLRIHDQRIRKSGEEVCRVVEKILAALKEQPEDISKAHQLFSYYLQWNPPAVCPAGAERRTCCGRCGKGGRLPGWHPGGHEKDVR